MRRYVTHVLTQHLQVTRMKTFIVALVALVASASTGRVRDRHETGISSGYGGAFGYTLTPISISDNGYLQSDAAPHTINPNTELLSAVAITNGYGGAYGYSSSPVVAVNKVLPASLAISSGYGGSYGYIPTPSIIIPNKKLLTSVAISSGYGGAYGYRFPGSVVNDSNRMKANLATSDDFNLPRSVNVKSESQSGVATSTGYGGAYGYAPIPRVIVNGDAISGSNGGGYSVASAVNVREMKTEMPQAMKAGKVSLPQLSLNYVSGYSGYGNRISSDSGYSRYPNSVCYGFAYANGWL